MKLLIIASLLAVSSLAHADLNGDTDTLLGGSKPATQAAPDKQSKGVDIIPYIQSVQMAIQRKFYDIDTFKGQKCKLKMSINLDGKLQSATAQGGNAALCEASINAARMAKFPKMYSPELLPAFTNFTLEIAP